MGGRGHGWGIHAILATKQNEQLEKGTITITHERKEAPPYVRLSGHIERRGFSRYEYAVFPSAGTRTAFSCIYTLLAHNMQLTSFSSKVHLVAVSGANLQVRGESYVYVLKAGEEYKH